MAYRMIKGSEEIIPMCENKEMLIQCGTMLYRLKAYAELSRDGLGAQLGRVNKTYKIMFANENPSTRANIINYKWRE